MVFFGPIIDIVRIGVDFNDVCCSCCLRGKAVRARFGINATPISNATSWHIRSKLSSYIAGNTSRFFSENHSSNNPRQTESGFGNIQDCWLAHFSKCLFSSEGSV